MRLTWQAENSEQEQQIAGDRRLADICRLAGHRLAFGPLLSVNGLAQ